MKHRKPILVLLALLAGLLLASAALGAEEGAGVPPTPRPPRGDLHIRTHHVEVVLNNGFATTRVDQVLANPQTQDIEAEWAFPLPKEASSLPLRLAKAYFLEELIGGNTVTQFFVRDLSGWYSFRQGRLIFSEKFFGGLLCILRFSLPMAEFCRLIGQDLFRDPNI